MSLTHRHIVNGVTSAAGHLAEPTVYVIKSLGSAVIISAVSKTGRPIAAAAAAVVVVVVVWAATEF